MRTDRPAWRVASLGLLCALALALSFLESLLPALPVPGAKWGLSNLAVMAALSLLGLPDALAVAAVKAGFAFFRGGIAGAMSLVGGLLSTLVMAAARRFPRTSPLGVGVLGAAAHNIGQLLAAMALLSPSLIDYGPWLLLAGLPTGILTGLTARIIVPLLTNKRLIPDSSAPRKDDEPQ